MKKIFLILMAAFLTVISYAQEEHMKFLGVEMNDFTKFKEHIERNGFKFLQKSNNIFLYSGLFQEEKCTLKVEINNKCNKVLGCQVIFEEGHKSGFDWDSILRRLDSKYTKTDNGSYGKIKNGKAIGGILKDVSTLTYIDLINYNEYKKSGEDDL